MHTGLPSIYAVNNSYLRTKPLQVFTWVLLLSLVPYVSVRTYNRIERLGYWEARIEKRRVKKMAFDYMLKS